MAGKSIKLNDADKSAFKVLRSKGLIPKDWKAAGITDYKRKAIRKAAKDYGFLLKNPQAYSVRKVSKDTRERMESAGYKVNKVKGDYRVILPTKGVEKQFIKNGKLTIYRMRRKEEVFYTGGLRALSRLTERFDKHPLKENQFWTLKIGSKMSFISEAAPFKTVESTAEYYMYALTDSGKASVIDQDVQLVRVTIDPNDDIYSDFDQSELAQY